MQIGILGSPGSWYCRELERAAAELGQTCVRFEFPQLIADVRCGETLLSPALQMESTQGTWAINGHPLTEFGALIVRTMPPGSLEQVVFRMDALASLEAAGVSVLNPPKAIECAVDKYLTTARLSVAGLPVPRTVVCERAESALEVFEELGGDVVVKPLFGAEGRGIVRVSDPDLALRTFRTLERIQAVLYLQRFIDHPGWDVRVLVLDGQILGGIRRFGTDDFRTNVARQGRAERYELSVQEQDWALRAAAVTGTSFAGVDLLYDREGRGYVIEVNAVPGWRAFQRATGCDVPRMVIEHLIRQRSEGRTMGSADPLWEPIGADQRRTNIGHSDTSIAINGNDSPN